MQDTRTALALPLARAAAVAFRGVCSAALLWTLACQGFPGFSRVQTPEVSVTNVAPAELSGFEPRARVDLRLSNPNEFPLEIDGLRFELDLNGRRFASGRSGELVTIPRLGDATVSVDVATSLLEMLGQAGALDSDLGYRIHGDLFLQKPELRTLRFEYASDSLSR